MRNPPERVQAEWSAIEKEARKLFAKEKISTRKPVLFIERDGNKVLGAVAGAVDQDRIGKFFAFDVVVDSKHHGKGIGKQLIKAVNDYYENMKHNLPDGLRAKIHVINPAVEHLLQKLGYHFTSQRAFGSTMEKY